MMSLSSFTCKLILMLALNLIRSMMNWQKHKESWKRSYKNLKPIHQGKDTNYKNKYSGKQVFYYFSLSFKNAMVCIVLIMVTQGVRKVQT